ncbi:MAG: hypothetical protein DMF62_04130 [Acidobacteria bacterium]|nr:MAG: hypothetical protein DMF62_04130 [Acidobacteriota bacterium]
MKRLAIVMLILSSAALSCKLLDSIKGVGGGSGSGVASSDPRADIVAASRKFIDLKSFSAKMEGTGQTEIKQQVDYVAPDRYHVTYLGGTGAGMELIYIGSESYMKFAGGKWSKMPGDAKAIPNLRDSFTEEGLKTLTDVKFESGDMVDGKPALVYSYKNQTIVGNYPFTSKIWIGKDTGLPMKVFVEYTNGVLKNMTVNYDTESPVTIEAPIN